jgi:periplasmic copper chaperone A
MFSEPSCRIRLAFTALLLWAGGSAAQAPPEVNGAWIRGTVPGQHATGAFMSITSTAAVALVGAETPVAQSAEVHEMSMAGNVMHMRPVARLAVPAGGRVDLKPGGYHLMLTGLKAPLKTGDRVPLKLFFEGVDRQRREIAVQAEVRDIAAK